MRNLTAVNSLKKGGRSYDNPESTDLTKPRFEQVLHLSDRPVGRKP